MMNQLRTSALLLVAGCLLFAVTGCHNSRGTLADHKKQAQDRFSRITTSYKIQLAMTEFETGDLDQAELTILGALANDPKHPKLHILAGRIALERGQLERSYKRLSLAIKYDEKMPEAYYFQGIVLQRWKQFPAAHKAYAKAFELQPDSVPFLLAMCEMMVEIDQREQAIALLNEKTSYFPQNAGVRLGLASLYRMSGDQEKAVEFYRQASLLRPDDLSVKEDLAASRMASGQFEQAVKDYEYLATKVEADRKEELSHALADAYLAAGRFDDARQHYIDLVQRNRSDVESWIHLAEISLATDDYNAALTAASRAISLARNRHEGYLVAGIVWKKRGDTEKALVNFDRAARLAPKLADAVIMRGLTLEEAGRHEAAAQAYAEAQRRDPSDKRATSLLASVTQKQTP
jgi:tetratricopeptide (TPR) repeat protein